MYGNVGEAAQDLKRILLTAQPIWNLAQSEPILSTQIMLYMSRLDTVNVSAGPYFDCTHNFLLSFYGTLTTYVVILLQSL